MRATVGILRLKKLQNNITNEHEMTLIKGPWFKGPMVYGIEFEKGIFFGCFAEMTTQFAKQTSTNISDVEKWLIRPEKWTYISTTTFVR
jgi:hypothetical protein